MRLYGYVTFCLVSAQGKSPSCEVLWPQGFCGSGDIMVLV